MSEVRFDKKTEAFAKLSAAYREAIDHADRLVSKLHRAALRGDVSAVEALEAKLIVYEERIEEARRTVEAHTRATLARPMRTRAKPTAVTRCSA